MTASGSGSAAAALKRKSHESGAGRFIDFIYNSPEAMKKRADAHFTIVATENQRLTGVIEIRNNRHISLLFVLPEFQGKGIGRNLWTKALQRIQETDSDIRELTVSSSLYAIAVYERFGFQRKGGEQVANGLRFFPMVLNT